MTLFTLGTPIQARGDLVTLNDTRGRLSAYFIWDEGDGSFLKFKPLRAEAQEFITELQVQAADCLDADVGIPIFSEKARDVFARDIPDELDFYAITVAVRSASCRFYLAKTNVYRNLVDEERSTFRAMRDGGKLLQVAAYRSDIAPDFAIARDATYRERLVATRKMIDIIGANGLAIAYEEIRRT
ncbi:hypothetical protein IP92_05903 [Pseudoduganella flava]|uniref:DUF1488 family protein n=1 Tax=Pseudoduganella flava TaxID=871742 RepID=A0A562P866_9BURK|nr:hypothetical protein [Pseudoduganella flava]QGZ40037.1 hypothetical protein GO485_13875 [Pseudoduganella flava]TWI40186.1 hypothetical protein IP92_05903 [Pseudoduganella flava]